MTLGRRRRTLTVESGQGRRTRQKPYSDGSSNRCLDSLPVLNPLEKIAFLFTDDATPEWYNELAKEFKGKLVFATSDSSQSRLTAYIGVTANDFPVFYILVRKHTGSCCHLRRSFALLFYCLASFSVCLALLLVCQCLLLVCLYHWLTFSRTGATSLDVCLWSSSVWLGCCLDCSLHVDDRSMVSDWWSRSHSRVCMCLMFPVVFSARNPYHGSLLAN